jgi:hypothetical protein
MVAPMLDPTTAPRPEAALAAAVIVQAWNDALAAPGPKASAQRATPDEHVAARRFLLDHAGPWAASREVVAQAAGICAQALRDRAAAALPPAPLAMFRPQVSAHPRAPDGHTRRDQVLAVIRAAALAGLPCPTNRELAARHGLASRAGNIANLVRELCAHGRLRLERHGRRRIACDPDGAWRTATPGDPA